MKPVFGSNRPEAGLTGLAASSRPMLYGLAWRVLASVLLLMMVLVSALGFSILQPLA